MKRQILLLCLILFTSFKISGQDLKTVVNKYFQSVGGKEVIESIKTSSFSYQTINYSKNDTTYTETKQKSPNQEISLTYNNHRKLESQSVRSKDSLHLFLTHSYLMKFSIQENSQVFIDAAAEILNLYKSKSLSYSKTDTLNGNQYQVLETTYSGTKPSKAFYFDNQTGLLMAQKATTTTFFNDYHVVNGFLTPFLREKYLNKTLLERILYENIQLNVDLGDDDFKPRNFDTPPLRKMDSKYNKVLFVEASYSDATYQDLIKSFHGKRILIDIWATWCGPCKYEFTKYDDDLYKFLSDRSIDLLFISIDKPERENIWKRELLWFNTNGYHMRANKNLVSSISESLNEGKSFTIPRYILINESGEILSNNLGRPSSPDFQEKVNKLLN